MGKNGNLETQQTIHRQIQQTIPETKGPSLSLTAYTAHKQTLLGPIGADTLEIGLWGLWAELSLKYHLQNAPSTITLRETVSRVAQGAIKNPFDIATIDKMQVIALDQTLFTDGAATLLWQCAKCQFEYLTNRAENRLHQGPEIRPTIPDKIKGKSIDDTGSYREHKGLADPLALPSDCDKLAPGAEVELLGRAGIDKALLTRYLSLGGES